MLGQLCRYLRAAGYDTLFDNNGDPDRDLLRLCREQGRYFLTQDRLVGKHKAASGVAFILPQAPLDQLAAAVGARYRLDWISLAFTRCLVDNALLLAADATALQRVPTDALNTGEPSKVCPACMRVYWRGSHFKCMRARLMKWQAARTGVPHENTGS